MNESSSPSKEFFEAFDALSLPLRKAAVNTCNLLTTIKNPPNEIQQMIKALNSLNLAQIENIDQSILQLKQAVNLLNLKLQDKTFLDCVQPERLNTLMTMEKTLVEEAYNLLEKGDALFKKGG